MIVIDEKVLRHLETCGECSYYNEGYSHLYRGRSSWSFEQELMHAMVTPIDDACLSKTTF